MPYPTPSAPRQDCSHEEGSTLLTTAPALLQLTSTLNSTVISDYVYNKYIIQYHFLYCWCNRGEDPMQERGNNSYLLTLKRAGGAYMSPQEFFWKVWPIMYSVSKKNCVLRFFIFMIPVHIQFLEHHHKWTHYGKPSNIASQNCFCFHSISTKCWEISRCVHVIFDGSGIIL